MAAPFAIGGVGGSGTRVVASLLQALGCHLGDDLNEPLDNLAFTLLFKRRSVLLDDEEAFRRLAVLFFGRLAGDLAPSDEDRARVAALAAIPRPLHPRAWLAERARALLDGAGARSGADRPDAPWGWKEPNTHVVLDRLLAARPDLRAIHVVRHPLDMALSANQNQLAFWGPVFLDRDVAIDPRTSLAYWCAAHRRVERIVGRFPDRVLLVDFDAFCRAPESGAARIARFVGLVPPQDVLAAFAASVRPPGSTGRYRQGGVARFDPDDLATVARLGFPL